MTKAYLIFLTLFLSLMLFSIPVYAAESDEQTLEQQEQEQVQEPEQAQEDGQQEQTQITSAEEGVFNLTILKNANLRAEPTTDSKSVIVIPFGLNMASSQRVANSNGEIWYAIAYGGMGGYISSDVVEVEAVYVNDSEDAAEDQEGAEENEKAQQQEAVPMNTVAPKQVEDAKTSDTSGTDSSVLTTTSGVKSNTDKPVTRKVDFIFIVFLSVVIVGAVISFIVFGRLRREYARYRKQILRNRKDSVLQD